MTEATTSSINHAATYELVSRTARSTVAVIDAITQRGGFKGEELTTIGALRDQAIQLIQTAETFQREQAQQE